jgi:hypothetical protein
MQLEENTRSAARHDSIIGGSRAFTAEVAEWTPALTPAGQALAHVNLDTGLSADLVTARQQVRGVSTPGAGRAQSPHAERLKRRRRGTGGSYVGFRARGEGGTCSRRRPPVGRGRARRARCGRRRRGLRGAHGREAAPSPAQPLRDRRRRAPHTLSQRDLARVLDGVHAVGARAGPSQESVSESCPASPGGRSRVTRAPAPFQVSVALGQPALSSRTSRAINGSPGIRGRPKRPLIRIAEGF